MIRWPLTVQVVASVALVALLLLAALTIAVLAQGQPRPTQATVVSIANDPTGTFVRVTARSPEGYIGSLVVDGERLSCSVGGTINVDVIGNSLIITERSCGGA